MNQEDKAVQREGEVLDAKHLDELIPGRWYWVRDSRVEAYEAGGDWHIARYHPSHQAWAKGLIDVWVLIPTVDEILEARRAHG